MQVKKQQLELDMEQQTGSKSGKEYIKAVYCHIRRGGKNTQKNYTKKDLHEPDSHDGVITDLEPDILQCKVKWTLGSYHYEQS